MFINTPFDSLCRINLERALRQVEENRQREFEAILPNLLPLLPEHASSLTRQQWKLLFYVLHNRRYCVGTCRDDATDDATVVAVLQALQQCAGTVRLPYPTFWIRTVTFLWAKEEGAIAEAAEACLPLLHTQVQRGRSTASRSRVA